MTIYTSYDSNWSLMALLSFLCTLYTLGSHFTPYVCGRCFCFMAPISCGYILISLWLLATTEEREVKKDGWERERALRVLSLCSNSCRTSWVTNQTSFTPTGNCWHQICTDCRTSTHLFIVGDACNLQRVWRQPDRSNNLK